MKQKDISKNQQSLWADLRDLTKKFDARSASLYKQFPDGILRCVTSYNRPQLLNPPLKPGEGIMGWLLLNTPNWTISEDYKDDYRALDDKRSLGLGSLAVFKLYMGQRLIGLLEFETYENGFFSKEWAATRYQSLATNTSLLEKINSFIPAPIHGPEEMDALLVNSPMPIIKTENKKVSSFNWAASRLLGYSPEDVLGRSPDFIYKNKLNAKLIDTELKNKLSIETDFLAQGAGFLIPLKMTTVRITEEQSVIYLEDIRQRERDRLLLEVSNKLFNLEFKSGVSFSIDKIRQTLYLIFFSKPLYFKESSIECKDVYVVLFDRYLNFDGAKIKPSPLVFVKGNSIGKIVMRFDKRLDSDAMSFLSSVSLSVFLAIQKAKDEDHRLKLETLAELNKWYAIDFRHGDISKLLENVLGHVYNNWTPHAGELLIEVWELKDRVLRPIQSVGRRVSNVLEVQIGQGIIGICAQTKEIKIIQNIANNPQHISNNKTTKSEIALPIFADERLIGVLNIETPLVNAFNEAAVSVFKYLAAQVSVIIQTTRYHEELRQQGRYLGDHSALHWITMVSANWGHDLRGKISKAKMLLMLQERRPSWDMELQQVLNETLDIIPLLAPLDKVAQDKDLDLYAFIREYFEKNKSVDFKIIVDLKSPSSAAPIITASPAWLKVLFQLLLSNTAREFSKNPRDKPKWFKIIGTLSERTAEIKFRDNGRGIPLQLKGKLFNQVLDKEVDQPQGAGMGLTLAKMIVQTYKGDIRVNWDYTEGAEFILTLPITLVTKGDFP